MNTINFEEFPDLLKEIPNPPDTLYVIGNLPTTETKLLCVVGSRKYSQYGKEVCEDLIRGLTRYDITIVSGLALGIDTIAHTSALKAGLKTVAIPGSSLDEKSLYPRSNYSLSKRIVERGGCLISEFEPGTPGYPGNFPKRNRIMAGMSHATLLIEAGDKSGTLITAKFAADYNRELLAVPGSIFEPNAYGTHQFIRMGATLVTTSDDILDALGLKTLFPFQKGGRKETIRSYSDCSPEELRIIELLKQPMSRDDLIRTMRESMQPSQTNSLLSLMEIKGILKESLGEFHLA